MSKWPKSSGTYSAMRRPCRLRRSQRRPCDCRRKFRHPCLSCGCGAWSISAVSCAPRATCSSIISMQSDGYKTGVISMQSDGHTRGCISTQSDGYTRGVHSASSSSGPSTGAPRRADGRRVSKISEGSPRDYMQRRAGCRRRYTHYSARRPKAVSDTWMPRALQYSS